MSEYHHDSHRSIYASRKYNNTNITNATRYKECATLHRQSCCSHGLFAQNALWVGQVCCRKTTGTVPPKFLGGICHDDKANQYLLRICSVVRSCTTISPADMDSQNRGTVPYVALNRENQHYLVHSPLVLLLWGLSVSMYICVYASMDSLFLCVCVCVCV